MARRRLVALVTVLVIGALGALVRAFAPGQFETTVGSAAELVERTPEPVIVGVTVVGLSVGSILLLVYVVRVYYWAWRQVEGPVTRFWNALLPESPIVRFGVGLTIMVFVFLIGPLVVLQALDLFENDEPVEDQQTDNGQSDNATDSENEETSTANTYADEPDSPDEPPGTTGLLLSPDLF